MSEVKELRCRECGAKVSIKEIEKSGNVCPNCNKETSWFTEPEFFIID